MSDVNRSKMNRRRFVYDQSDNGLLPPNRVGNESAEFTIRVAYIPASVNRETVINFASQFGMLRVEPFITLSSERLQKVALLTFTQHAAVERCMNGPRETYTINGHPVVVQRWLPIGLTFSRSYRLLLSLERSSSDCLLNENDLRAYFETHYGRTKAFAWTSEFVATIDFDDYDSVDRAILASPTHTINGVKVRLEKVQSSNVRAAYHRIIAPNSIKYCVHVKNVPPHISGEQLADLFVSNVWDVLIRRGLHSDTDPMEAWILEMLTMADAEELAEAVKSIAGVDVQCTVEEEPLNEYTLCSGNRDGWCKHDKDCIYRHILCVARDECKKEECPFSHSKQRKVVPIPRHRPPGPVEQQYRIKIDGLPYSMTATELVTELKKQPLSMLKLIETPEMPKGAITRYFYLTRQAAEKLARKRVYEWHNYRIRESYLVKCQLEYDRSPVTSLSQNSSLTGLQINNQRLRTLFSPLAPGGNEIYGMPSQWVWTNRRLRQWTDNVYLVYPSESTNDDLGAIKIYHCQNDLESLRVKRELLALRALENEQGVVSVCQSNIPDETRKNEEPMWMIMPVISELTLEEFVKKYKSEIDFHQALRLTRQILEIIQRCHKVHIVHRNLQPNNIMIQLSNDYMAVDEIRLVLIGFGLVWFDSQELSITDKDDVNILSEASEKYAIMNSKQPSDNITSNTIHHLLSFPSKNERCNPALDSNSICRILFWMLTNEWPTHQRSTTCPHREKENLQMINEKLGDAKINKSLCEQIMHLFDRSFGPMAHWWTVDELLKHLDTIDVLLVEFETAQLDFMFPTTATGASLLPLNDPYARMVALIARVKQEFIQQYSVCMKWSNGSNRWLNKSKDFEIRNTDELVYDYRDRRCTTPIVLSAKIESDRTILLLGTETSDGTIEQKPLYSWDKDTNDIDVSKYFDNAVKKLIKDKLKRESASS